jgi:hypothetical protein
MAATATSGWWGTTRPGGWGQLAFDGVDDTVTAPLVGPLADYSIATWVYLADASREGAFVKVGDEADGVGIGVGSGTLNVAGNNLIMLAEQVAWNDSGVAIGTGWHHVGITYDGSTLSFFIDGRVVAQQGATSLGPTGSTHLGGYIAAGFPRFFAGPLDDVSIYDRALAAAEFRALYDLSRRGYPGVLNRAAPYSIASAPAAPTGGTAVAVIEAPTSAPVLLADPLNRDHPLNRGRLAWWLALPGLDGGRMWYDLAGTNHGTLTDMAATATSGWWGTTRPGGWGQLAFDGVDDTVTAPLVGPLADYSIATWVYLADASREGAFVKVGDEADGVGIGVGSGTLNVAGNNLIMLAEQVAWNDSGVAIGTGWHHVGITYDGSTLSFFIDGRVVAQQGATSLGPTGSTHLGGYIAAGFPRFFAGPLDDVSIYDRALAAAEFRALYDLSRRGYPGVLNRAAPYLMTAAAGGRRPPRILVANLVTDPWWLD